MSLLSRLQELLTKPRIGTPAHVCADCGLAIDPESAACPECGGDVVDIPPDPRLEYWGPEI